LYALRALPGSPYVTHIAYSLILDKKLTRQTLMNELVT
jgi:hypothetical protein